MLNVCIKHMNKVFDCYKTYYIDKDNKFVTFVIKYMFNV